MRRDHAEVMMETAKLIAARGTCDRLQVGAIITRNARIVSSGYNGNVSGAPHCNHSEWPLAPCSTAVHAEANAIVFAARHGVGVEGAEMWCTHQPCLACANLIINAGSLRVFRYAPEDHSSSPLIALSV